MKITIAYTREEERDACTATRHIMRLFPAVRVHKSESKAMYSHIYMTTKKAGKPHEIKDFEIGRE